MAKKKVVAKEQEVESEVKKTKGTPTVAQIKSDKLTLLANQYWSPHENGKHLPFNADIIVDIYRNEITAPHARLRNIILLEFSQYLENYLWPNFDAATSSLEHVMSIVFMCNEKFRERVNAWNSFEKNPAQFSGFFQRVLDLSLSDEKLTPIVAKQQTALILFLNHCFNSMEVELCRNQTKKLVSLGMWQCLQPDRREAELNATPQWKKYWKKLQKKDKSEQKEQLEFERLFLQRLMVKFIGILEEIPEEGPICIDAVRYCERFLELVIDLEALLPTRRFFNTVLDDCHLVVRCALAPLVRRPEGQLFLQLLDTLKFYSRFEINDETGDALTDHDMTQIHYKKIIDLQRAAFDKFPELKLFALTNVNAVDTRGKLYSHFEMLNENSLKQIARSLHLLPNDADSGNFKWHRTDVEFLRELLISRHERRVSQLDALNDMPLYPTGESQIPFVLFFNIFPYLLNKNSNLTVTFTENIIWDENIVPNEYYSGEGCLSLPKLNLQFLTLHDYLLRNCNLFRLESTFEIRQDIEDAVSRMLPWRDEEGQVMFAGWARMV